MGYDLHITRKEFSASLDGPAISPEEWLAVIADDLELTIRVLNNGNGLSHPYHADWAGPGKYPCWLDHSNGNLYTKNPTDEMIDKMVQIAKRLDAKVQGDEGGLYLGGGQATTRDHTGQWFVYSLNGSKTPLKNDAGP